MGVKTRQERNLLDFMRKKPFGWALDHVINFD